MKVRSGTIAWGILAGYVVAWDYAVARLHRGETLSYAFRRATLHPVMRWPVILAWGITTLHLFGVLKPDADPFVLVGRKVNR